MAAENGTWFHPAFVLFFLGLVIAGLTWRRISFRRAAQVLSVALFVSLFWLAAYSGRPAWPVDFFLFSDPLLALAHTLAARALVPLTLVSLVFLALAALMGRVFCSHICPLGALFDVSDRSLGRKQKAKGNRVDYRRARRAKYAILLIVLAAAGVGYDLLGYTDPIVIVTRFSAALFYPAVMVLQDAALDALRPVASWLDWTGLLYSELYLPSFAGAMAMLALLTTLLLLARMQPRFWCRHLCPLGGLLGWVGHYAPYRRLVDDACTACDACTRACPTGAIHLGGEAVDRHECIVCLRCVDVCPEGAVRFAFCRPPATRDQAGPVLSRRGFFASVTGGLAVGVGFRADLSHPAPRARPASVRPSRLVRPPGAVPEPEFLSRCVRCGECLRACVTNTLQPDWYRAGLEGLWAPHMNLRHAHCELACNACGQICPTGAIRPLDLVEKKHARVGTAVIQQRTCLAWAEDRRCLVCDEICPCNAIYTKRDAAHKVGLPVVEPRRCLGCGACEKACPVLGEAAIVVVAHGEIRLSEGSYVAEARARGYRFSGGGDLPDQVFEDEIPGGANASGAAPADGRGEPLPELPPGISPDEEEEEHLPPLPPGIDPDGQE